MPAVYTKRAMVERVEKHLNNDFPTNDFKITTSEILLYIDTAIPFVLKGLMWENAKVSGVIDISEAWLATYQFTVSNQDSNTLEWFVTLPQPPLALPTGYDIPNTYFAGNGMMRGQNVFPIKAKRTAYRNNMPKPLGVFYRIEGYKMYLQATDNTSLLNEQLFVQMPISRTSDVDLPMNIPDDAIEPLFTKTVQTILQRYGIPVDTVEDELPVNAKP